MPGTPAREELEIAAGGWIVESEHDSKSLAAQRL